MRAMNKDFLNFISVGGWPYGMVGFLSIIAITCTIERPGPERLDGTDGRYVDDSSLLHFALREQVEKDRVERDD